MDNINTSQIEIQKITQHVPSISNGRRKPPNINLKVYNFQVYQNFLILTT